ncbi:MAG: hypothetical protein PHS44_04180 [Candidatus Dojkabacteria bacterium]|jgi:hypothetical protein|nr:hypothetical protein [Candidatus Dojkabacteria bacterium]
MEEDRIEPVVTEATLDLNAKTIAVSALMTITGIVLVFSSPHSEIAVGTAFSFGGFAVYFASINRFGYLRRLAVKNRETLTPRCRKILNLENP